MPDSTRQPEACSCIETQVRICTYLGMRLLSSFSVSCLLRRLRSCYQHSSPTGPTRTLFSLKLPLKLPHFMHHTAFNKKNR